MGKIEIEIKKLNIEHFYNFWYTKGKTWLNLVEI
jgi:hypothetical protein